VAGKRHGSVAQLELEARCLLEDPNTTVTGHWSAVEPCQRESEPLAHAGVTAGEGRGVRTKRLGSTCNRRASNACARRTLTQTNERIESQNTPDETEPPWLSFRAEGTFSET
jgi:hypothetical protein